MNLFFCLRFHMEDAYRTLEKPTEGLFRDRNSRFIAFGYPVDHITQVSDLLIQVRKKYHDARHHCYAFRIGPKKDQYKLNDDGEPSGTAGKPIYNQIVAYDLTDVLIIVVRYFGGTLLGTGGLIHAYKSATVDMLMNANILIKYMEDCYLLKFPYDKLNVVMKILKEENLIPGDPVYAENCHMKVQIRKNSTARFLQKMAAVKEITTEICK
jgi:uncharacterized YigZ family protein